MNVRHHFSKNITLYGCVGLILASLLVIVSPAQAQKKKKKSYTYSFWIKPEGVSKKQWSTLQKTTKALRKARKAKKAEIRKLNHWKKVYKQIKQVVGNPKFSKRSARAKSPWLKRMKREWHKAKQAHLRYNRLKKKSKKLSAKLKELLRIKAINAHVKKWGKRFPKENPATLLKAAKSKNVQDPYEEAGTIHNQAIKRILL